LLLEEVLLFWSLVPREPRMLTSQSLSDHRREESQDHVEESNLFSW